MSDLRIAALVSHPIQYQAPLFRDIASRDGINVRVYFGSHQGVKPMEDKELGQEVVWDVPLLDGYEYVFLNDWSPVGGAESIFRLNPGIISPLRAGTLDVLWVHGYEALTNWLAILTAYAYDVPVVFRGEAMPDVLENHLKSFGITGLLRCADAFASIGTRNRKFYYEIGISEERIFHVPYSVDNEFFQEHRRELPEAAILREQEELPIDRQILLFVGKLVERKRPDLLLDAFVESTDPGEAALLYVGDGPLRNELEQTVTNHGRENDVYFTGFVNQSVIPRYYKLSDLFVLPSVHENWGLVINEAMNFGLPIVTTDAVGASDDLVNDENGRVIPADDGSALVQTLTELVDNTSLGAMGETSANRITDWGIKETADGLIEAAQFVSNQS